mmetsp:Transcript_12486/g.31616  ORF Transcript_12486/g.31616 Transcript_12486/m.31616 type:complete len:147 (+) Transcript_12486:602-1042(+)
MGSLVATAFLSVYPHLAVGFLNLDGVPHSFHRERKLFERFGAIYRFEASLVWTGLLRLAVTAAGGLFRRYFASVGFPTELLLVQASEHTFFANIAAEMPLMMDLAATTSEALGGAKRRQSHRLRAQDAARGQAGADWRRGQRRELT